MLYLYVIGAIIAVIALYFMFTTSSFADMDCNPQIENACGEAAKCHPDETGVKGICFPKGELDGS
jgi:hypothetical protein